MKTLTATSARTELFQIIKRSIQTHQPYHITSRAGEVILISKQDFESLIETLELLSSPSVLEGVRRAKRDIAQGRTFSLEEVFGS